MTASGEIGHEPGFEPVAQRGHAGALRCQGGAGGRGGGAKAGDPRDILGAGAGAALLAAAPDERIERASAASRLTSAPTPLGPPILCPEASEDRLRAH